MCDRIKLKRSVAEYQLVRLKGYKRAMLMAGSRLGKRHFGSAGNHLFILSILPFKLGAVGFIIMVYLYRCPLRKGVDHRRADAVQSAAEFILGIVELSARVKLGKDHLHAGNSLLRVNIHRHTAAVVLHADAVALIKRNGHLVGVPVGGLINRIVHNLP